MSPKFDCHQIFTQYNRCYTWCSFILAWFHLKKSCIIFSTRNNCGKFFASDGVILQNDHPSHKRFLIECDWKRLEMYF